MPLTCICGTIGALAISSFPFTSGFVTKSMTAEDAAAGHLMWVWLGLAAASAGVFLHAGIKFPWFVFFRKDSGLRPPDPAVEHAPGDDPVPGAVYRPRHLALTFVCTALPYAVDYVPYTASHVVAQLQLLLFSRLPFFVMLPWLKRTLIITPDFDWFYRVAGFKLANAAINGLAHAGAYATATLCKLSSHGAGGMR